MITCYCLNKIIAKGCRVLTFRSQSHRALASLHRKLSTIISCLFIVLVAAGCASTKVTSRNPIMTEQLTRPAHIWVYDFAATAGDLPADSALAGQYLVDTTAQTAEHIATGRELGDQIAAQLVEQIRSMGLPAEHAVTGTTPLINDIVIRGYLISFDEGSAAKRLVIGFGAGSSELKAAVEGFQVTAQGLRRLGSGTTASGGSKSPGTAVSVASTIATHNPAGLIVSSGVKMYGEKSGRSKVEGRAKETAEEIADVLKKRFQQEGWIN